MSVPLSTDPVSAYRAWLSARVDDLGKRSEEGANMLPIVHAEARHCLSKFDEFMSALKCVACGVELEPGWHFAHCGRKECADLTPRSTQMSHEDMVSRLLKNGGYVISTVFVDQVIVRLSDLQRENAQIRLDLAQHAGNASAVIRLQNANDSLRAALQEIRTLEERHTVCVARKIASEALAGGAVDPNLYAGAKL